MNREELKTYLAAQIQEIQKYKWLESERTKCDIGFERAAFEWIHQYGEAFRRDWFADRIQKAR
jgi:hypothetical protein